MRCHSTPNRAPKELIRQYGSEAGFGEKIGSMRAFISLKIPLEKIMGMYNKDFFLSLFILFILFALFYWFIYILDKKEQKLLRELEKRDSMLKKANEQLKIRVEEEIGQRLEQERLLTHQSKLASMGEMIGNIAHQWRQPLTQLSAVMINMELQQEHGKLLPKLFEEKISEAQEQIQYMSGTIDDFRNFFAPENKKESYYISVPVNKVEKLIGASLRNNSIELNISIDKDFLLVGYPNEIAQALLNIIGNAKDVILERKINDGLIDIIIGQDEDKKTIIIQDNAGGIEADVIDKIFEPYFSTKQARVGTGIGLYMTKTIIETHNGGTIEVENYQGGARFVITFD